MCVCVCVFDYVPSDVCFNTRQFGLKRLNADFLFYLRFFNLALHLKCGVENIILLFCFLTGGTMPSSLSKLKKLKVLYLYSNNLSTC